MGSLIYRSFQWIPHDEEFLLITVTVIPMENPHMLFLCVMILWFFP